MRRGINSTVCFVAASVHCSVGVSRLQKYMHMLILRVKGFLWNTCSLLSFYINIGVPTL